jgi:hypothetical protein
MRTESHMSAHAASLMIEDSQMSLFQQADLSQHVLDLLAA